MAAFTDQVLKTNQIARKYLYPKVVFFGLQGFRFRTEVPIKDILGKWHIVACKKQNKKKQLVLSINDNYSHCK